jgi:cellulose synthase/poly-beta-1,6-N-acetylglucosamine synthase-like glycosyltransferase
MIFYAYFGYPLCLLIISIFKRSNRKDHDELSAIDYELPSVSFIITAYNEEARIKQKIENSLTQDYQKEKLEIIIASDCSSDKTDKIVKSFKDKGVKLVRAQERKGKENAQKHAVDAAGGEILVFSDVATILKPNAISNIVNNFKDPAIGCVSSEDKFIDKDGNVSGEGAYVKYEMYLRKQESKVNTLVGLSGSFFAARREVCKNWAIDLQSDFNTLLNSIKLGLKGFSDSNSIGYYENIADEKKEFNRKTRTVLRGISVLMRNLSLLNPVKYGLFSWQLFSHKLCRWLVPFLLLSAFISNAVIMFNSVPLFVIFILQISFYSLALYYYWQPPDLQTSKPSSHNMLRAISYQLSAISKLCYFFITVNLSILVAWWKYLKGERLKFWEPSKR